MPRPFNQARYESHWSSLKPPIRMLPQSSPRIPACRGTMPLSRDFAPVIPQRCGITGLYSTSSSFQPTPTYSSIIGIPPFLRHHLIDVIKPCGPIRQNLHKSLIIPHPHSTHPTRTIFLSHITVCNRVQTVIRHHPNEQPAFSNVTPTAPKALPEYEIQNHSPSTRAPLLQQRRIRRQRSHLGWWRL